MRFLSRLLPFVLLTALLLVSPPKTSATSIDPFTWQELVLNADFVGVIECTTAGGMVAHYKVVDSWKGAETGEEMAVRITLNYWGGQFPIALVGERYLVTAFKETPDSMISTSMGGPVPLWWRRVPADYSTPLLQGRVRLPVQTHEGYEPFRNIGSPHGSLDAFKTDVVKLLAMPPEEAEELLLRGQADKYLFSDRWAQSLPEDSSAREDLAKAEGAEALVEVLLGVARQQEGDRPSYPVFAALQRGGRETALGMLEGIPAETSPLGEEFHFDLLRRLRQRVGDVEETGESPAWETPAPSEEQMVEFHRLLGEDADYQEAGDAIFVLTEYDPEPVRDYLAKWESPEDDWRDRDAGYFLGSYFAWRVKDDRSRHLRSLLDARDPYVRVAAAVYLCFEDEEEGMERLQDFASLEGLPGVWAALTLARRGDKSAVERALAVFRNRPEIGEGDSNHHRNFEDRLRVLLSNTANASDIPQPDPPQPSWYDEEELEKIYRYYLAWWREHGTQAVLHDPWFELSEEQRVD